MLRSPLTMIGSDAGVGRHPKVYGTRARVLRRYVREQAVLSLEEAVRHRTSLPAERLRLSDRGVVRAGAMAELVVFDPAQIADRATRERPTEYSAGVTHVLVNGRAVILNGTLTTERPGRVVRGLAAVDSAGAGPSK